MLEMREKEICRRTIKRDVKVLSKGTDVMKSDLVSTRRRLHSLKNGCCSDRVVDYSIKNYIVIRIFIDLASRCYKKGNILFRRPMGRVFFPEI